MTRIQELLRDIEKDDFLFCNMSSSKITECNELKLTFSNSNLIAFKIEFIAGHCKLNYNKILYATNFIRHLDDINNNECIINTVKTIIKENMIVKNIIWAELMKDSFFIDNPNITEKYLYPGNLKGDELHFKFDCGKLIFITMEYKENTHMVEYSSGHKDNDFDGKFLLRDAIRELKTLIEDNIIIKSEPNQIIVNKQNPEVKHINENLAIVVLESKEDIKKMEEFLLTFNLPDLRYEEEIKKEDFFDIDIEKNECHLKEGINSASKVHSIKEIVESDYYYTAIGLYYKNKKTKHLAYEYFEEGHKLGYKMCTFQLTKMYAEDGKIEEILNMQTK